MPKLGRRHDGMDDYGIVALTGFSSGLKRNDCCRRWSLLLRIVPICLLLPMGYLGALPRLCMDNSVILVFVDWCHEGCQNRSRPVEPVCEQHGAHGSHAKA